ncbi:putative MFS family arabinose efflux permease [Bibersteinia trehalosi]|uniref:MFS transporter n=1 Tax=Bibersteinia trehalosi TaxID=47735 RepID=UPI00104F198F|nr:MFS transporter [Bibersteinia trehalosi]TCT17357.1 putative MFS family arabinose efflux permease [Bibersteinia trehalosi]
MSKNRAFFEQKNLGINFWLYRLAFVLINLGNIAITISISWWIFDTYQRAIYISYVVIPTIFISIISNILLSPLGDNFQRKKIIQVGIVIQIISCLIVILINELNTLSISALIIFQSLYTLGNGITKVGCTGFIVEIINKELLPKAHNIIMRINSTVSILSGTIGGWLFYTLGMTLSFMLMLFMLILASIMIYHIKTNSQINKKSRNINFYNDIKLGLNYTIKNPIVRILFIYSFIIGIAFGPMQIINVYMIKEVFKLESISYGFATSCIAIGVILGSFLYEPISLKFKRLSNFVFYSSIMLGFGFLAILNNNILIFYLALITIGISKNWINVSIDSKLISSLPDNLRTKVISNISFFGNLSIPISNLLSGYIIDTYNLNIIIILNSLFVIGISFIYLLHKGIIEFIDGDTEIAQLLLKE